MIKNLQKKKKQKLQRTKPILKQASKPQALKILKKLTQKKRTQNLLIKDI